MTPDTQALWLLSALGATVFAAAVPIALSSVVAMSLGFVLALFVVGTGRVPNPAWWGSVVALAAAAHLSVGGTGSVRGRLSLLAAAASGGALAAVTGVLLQVSGLTRVSALAGGAALPVVSGYLAYRRSDFAPPVLREEALLLVLGLGLAVAVVPSVADGWRSAVALNAQQPAVAGAAPLALPVWTLAVTAGSTVVGGLYFLFAAWRRG